MSLPVGAAVSRLIASIRRAAPLASVLDLAKIGNRARQPVILSDNEHVAEADEINRRVELSA